MREVSKGRITVTVDGQEYEVGVSELFVPISPLPGYYFDTRIKKVVELIQFSFSTREAGETIVISGEAIDGPEWRSRVAEGRYLRCDLSFDRNVAK